MPKTHYLTIATNAQNQTVPFHTLQIKVVPRKIKIRPCNDQSLCGRIFYLHKFGGIYYEDTKTMAKSGGILKLLI